MLIHKLFGTTILLSATLALFSCDPDQQNASLDASEPQALEALVYADLEQRRGRRHPEIRLYVDSLDGADEASVQIVNQGNVDVTFKVTYLDRNNDRLGVRRVRAKAGQRSPRVFSDDILDEIGDGPFKVRVQALFGDNPKKGKRKRDVLFGIYRDDDDDAMIAARALGPIVYGIIPNQGP